MSPATTDLQSLASNKSNQLGNLALDLALQIMKECDPLDILALRKACKICTGELHLTMKYSVTDT